MVARERAGTRRARLGRRVAWPLAAAAAAVCTLGGGGVSWAAETIRASALSDTYTAPSYGMAAGEVPIFTNDAVGDVPHDVAATARGPDGRFLFKSKVIGSNRSAPVNGTQYLAPGTYRFFCTIHGASMSANLEVGPGNPEARPRLQVTVLSRRIGPVRRAEKLVVRLSGAGSDARGVMLVAKLGGRRIAVERGVALQAGASRRLTMDLNRRGREALAGRDRAAVSVTATVPFGRPDTARRLLR
jgi:plastocyanin